MRVFLAAIGIVFAIIGAGFLIWPVQWGSTVGLRMPAAIGRIDVRATYGGFDLAFGLWLLAAAWLPSYTRAGLLTCALCLAGFAFGRALGAMLEGTLPRLMALFLVIEVVGAAIALAGWRSLGRPA